LARLAPGPTQHATEGGPGVKQRGPEDGHSPPSPSAKVTNDNLAQTGTSPRRTSLLLSHTNVIYCPKGHTNEKSYTYAPLYLHSVDRNNFTCTWTLVLDAQSSKPLYQNDNERGITYTLFIQGESGEDASGLAVSMFTLNWQPRLQTWKRYAAVKTAIIERVCYSVTLCLCRTVCPLTSVSICFAISRVQLYVKAQILLTMKQWFLMRQLLLWALTARTSLREQTSVESSPAVRGKMPC